MSTTARDARGSIPDATSAARTPANEQRLLWNPENVKDVAESVGIGNLGDEALRTLAQDVEYRIGQVIVEALRFMRAAKRTTMTIQEISQALKVLDVEPLYGYDSTRPLRYGEASLGPGQPLFYIEDEEVDFEKLINAPLPKVPRDMSFTGMIHWFSLWGQETTWNEVANQDHVQRTGWPLRASSHRSPRTPLLLNRVAKTYFQKVLAQTPHLLLLPATRTPL